MLFSAPFRFAQFRPLPVRRDALDPRRLFVVYCVGAFLYSAMDYFPGHLSHDARTAEPPLDTRMVHMAARVLSRIRSESQLSLADGMDELQVYKSSPRFVCWANKQFFVALLISQKNLFPHPLRIGERGPMPFVLFLSLPIRDCIQFGPFLA